MMLVMKVAIFELLLRKIENLASKQPNCLKKNSSAIENDPLALASPPIDENKIISVLLGVHFL